MSERRIRIGYLIVSTLIVLAAYYFASDVVDSKKWIDYFSYIGTVATIIALIITICEVINGVIVSKSIKQEANQIYERVKSIESASSISECLSEIDEVSFYVSKEDYISAVHSFKSFRKICVKVLPDLWMEKRGQSGLNLLGDVELFLRQASNATAGGELNKKQKSNLLADLQKIKHEVESNNPARRKSNVAG